MVGLFLDRSVESVLLGEDESQLLEAVDQPRWQGMEQILRHAIDLHGTSRTTCLQIDPDESVLLVLLFACLLLLNLHGTSQTARRCVLSSFSLRLAIQGQGLGPSQSS